MPQTGASYAKRVSPALDVGSDKTTTGPGASPTSGVHGNPTPSADGNFTVVEGASSTSSITDPITPPGSGNSTIDAEASSTFDIAGNSNSAASYGGFLILGLPPLGNLTSGLQSPVSTTSSRGPLGNSTSGVPPTGSATSFFYL